MASCKRTFAPSDEALCVLLYLCGNCRFFDFDCAPFEEWPGWCLLKKCVVCDEDTACQNHKEVPHA